jgi:cell division protein FtsA
MSASNVVRLTPKVTAKHGGRHELLGVLDIGTTKMCCLVARQRAGGRFELLGVGHQLAEGLRAGEIIDAEAAEASILAVVHEAEQQAGADLREVVLGVAGGRPHSMRSVIELEVGGRAVRGIDVTQGLAHARAAARGEDVEVLHALPVQITLDGSQPLRDPRGMFGRRLRLDIHLVCVRAAALYNMVAAVERCHLDLAGVVATPYATGLAALSDEEASFGALVLDLGGGVTGISRFADGHLQSVHTIPLGGHHITQDLALGLSTGRHEAERLKALYGSVVVRAGDRRQRLDVPGLGEPDDAPRQVVSRADLTEIIRPRVEEIFQLVQTEIDLDQLPLTGRRLVLTGGSSQLEGMIELAETLFGMPARLGRATVLDGAEGLEDLAAATAAAGLLTWAAGDDGGLTFGTGPPVPVATTHWARLGRWLRENF